MTQIIFRHNADVYKTQVKKYKIGQYQYHLTANSIVWWEESQKEHLMSATLNLKAI